MSQASLFDTDSSRGASRTRDPESSRAGGRLADVHGQRERIVAALRANPDGLTADELRGYLPEVAREQLCSRLALLRKDGRVAVVGTRHNGRCDVQLWATA